MLLIRFFIFFLFLSCESTFNQSYKVYQNTQEPKALIEFLEKELEKNPKNEQALFYLGELLISEGFYDRGKSYFDESLSISNKYGNDINYSLDKFYRLEMNKGIEYLKHSSYDLALNKFIYADQLIPNRVLTNKLISTTFFELKDYPNSVKYTNICLGIDPKEFDCGLILVNSLFLLEDYENSINKASVFISQNIKKYAFLKISLQASLKSKDFVSAETKFTDYFRGTRDLDALKEFGFMLYNENKIELAEPYLRLYHKQFTKDSDILRALSHIYFELNDYASMVLINEQLFEKYPGDLELKKLLMLSYELSGEIEKSQNLLKRYGN